MGVDTAAAGLWLVPLGAGYCKRPVWILRPTPRTRSSASSSLLQLSSFHGGGPEEMPASWLCCAVPQGPTSLLSLLGAVPWCKRTYIPCCLSKLNHSRSP